MVQIEGTYTNVKKQDFADFYVHLGVPKEEVDKAVGSHWTMKLWMDGDQYGGHITCKEHPQYNSLENFTEGVEKCVDSPFWGGKAKVVFTRKGDDEFVTKVESEKFGSMVFEEKYTDIGAHFKVTSKGKTHEEFWSRKIKITGAYRFDKGENIEAYFKATGASELIKYSKDYKVYLNHDDKTLNMMEWFGSLGKVCNTLTLDVESDFKVPGDKEGSDGSHKVLMTWTGHGKCLMVIKNPEGHIEEWNLQFTESGLIMNGLEKKTGKTCVFHMNRFVEISGTYNLVTMVGFKEFAQAMGVPTKKIGQVANDPTTKLVVSDLGNGCQRHQFICKDHGMDITFKLNEEFSFEDPLLEETVKAVATMQDSILCVTVKGSKGTLKSTIHFNDNFIVESVCHPGSGLGYKVIMQRCVKW